MVKAPPPTLSNTANSTVVVHSPSTPCPPPCSRLSPELRKEFVATIRSMAIGATLCGAMFALRWSLIVVAMVRTFRSSFKDKLLDVTLASNCGLSAVTYVPHPPAVCPRCVYVCLRSVQTEKSWTEEWCIWYDAVPLMSRIQV